MACKQCVEISFSRRARPARFLGPQAGRLKGSLVIEQNSGSIVARPHRGGFTLIELLLVLVILAVLAAVVVPKFTNRRQQANTSAAKTQVSNFELSLSQFEIDTGRFPTNDEGLESLVVNKSNLEGWNGYMKKIPLDPWGKPYIYRFPSNKPGGEYDVFSMGADGREGTEDDITN